MIVVKLKNLQIYERLYNTLLNNESKKKVNRKKIILRKTKLEIHHTKTYRIKQTVLGGKFRAINSYV